MELVTFVDENGNGHQAQINEVWSDDLINLMYYDENNTLIHKTSVPRRTEKDQTFCFFEKIEAEAELLEHEVNEEYNYEV